ncbi:MAG: glycosyltransferase family 4 protein [Candidatus Brocadiia bacterium]
MNILFSLDNYDHGTGGAEMSVQALAHQLAARGHRVQVLQRNDDVASYHDGPIAVHTRPLPVPRLIRDRDRDTIRWNRHWGPQLRQFLARYPADLVITQNRLLYSTVEEARRQGAPAIVFVRAYGVLCPLQFRTRDALAECDRRCKRCLPRLARLKYRLVRRNLDLYEQGLRGASLVAANSDYMRRVLEKFFGLEAEVVYPPVELASYRTDRPAGREVLFCKPQYVKGLPIFLDVASRMPERRFLVAGRLRSRARRRLGRLANVACLGWVSDMRQAYGRARVLLGPSIWPEPFGRVFVEAGANGIPSVASARGGIPEAVGDGGILVEDIFEPQRWVDALRRLDDEAVYAAYSRKARAHAERFRAEASAQRLADVARDRLGLEL